MRRRGSANEGKREEFPLLLRISSASHLSSFAFHNASTIEGEGAFFDRRKGRPNRVRDPLS